MKMKEFLRRNPIQFLREGTAIMGYIQHIEIKEGCILISILETGKTKEEVQEKIERKINGKLLVKYAHKRTRREIRIE